MQAGFVYVIVDTDKDLIYMKRKRRRLLGKEAQSMDAEDAIVSELKVACVTNNR